MAPWPLTAVVVDVATAAPGRLDAIAEVKRHLPHVRVLAVSGDGELDRAVAALEAGADGCMLGRRLSASERTVRRLLASLLGKMGAANRHEAAALAGQAGLLDD